MLVDSDGNTLLYCSLLIDQSLEEHQVYIEPWLRKGSTSASEYPAEGVSSNHCAPVH